MFIHAKQGPPSGMTLLVRTGEEGAALLIVGVVFGGLLAFVG